MISSEVWLTILKASPVPIAIFGFSGEEPFFLFANTAYLNLFGVRDENVVNKAGSVIFHSDGIHIKDNLIPDVLRSLRKAFESALPDKITNVELTFHDHDAPGPNVLYIDIENTPVIKDGIVSYISQTITEVNPAEYHLLNNERIFRSLAENGTDAIIILDPKGKPRYFSPSITRVLGYSKTETMSLDMYDLVHPSDRDSVAHKMEEVLQKPGETISGHTARIKHKDGSWRWIEVTLTNMLHDPLINGIVDNFRDVTKRVELENEKNLLINNTEESFVLLNMDLEIVSFNDQFARLYKDYFDTIIEKGKSILIYAQPERVDKLPEIYRRVLQGQSETAEIKLRNFSSGEEGIIAVKYKPAISPQGEVVGVFVTATDITERHLVLEALMESEKRYKLLFESSPVPKFVYDLQNFQILEVNNTASVHYGFTRAEFLNKTILDITAESERGRLLEIHKQIDISEHVVYFGMFSHLKKNGGRIKADISGYKIRYGDRDCMMTSCNDVTEREKAFQRIQENEGKLLAAQKIAKVGYWQSFPDRNDLYWSDEVYNIWGLDKANFNLNYDTYLSTIHPEDRDAFLESYERALKQGAQHDVELRILLPDGSIKWVHALGNLVKDEFDGIVLVEGTVQDITKDRLELEKLSISEARLKGIFESQTNYMLRTDLQGKYTFYNNKFKRDFGWLHGNKEMIGENSMISILEYHHARVAETVAKCFERPNKVFQVFIDKPRKEAQGVLTTLWDFMCLTDSKGKPSEMQCVGIDVSDWKHAQDALEASNARYEYVTRATSDAIWDWDLNTDEVYRGDGFRTLFGYPIATSETMLTFWKKLIHPEDVERVIDTIELVKSGKLETWTLEYRLRKAGGNYAFVIDKGIAISDKDGRPLRIVGAMQDVTEKKNLEVLLHKSNELAEIGSWEVDLRDNFLFWSYTTKQIHEVETDFQANIDTAVNFYSEGFSRDAIKNAVDQAINMGSRWDMELQIVTAKGNERWVRTIGDVEFLDGKCVKLYGSFQNITNRKVAELELLKIYDEKNTILESIRDGFYSVDKEWMVKYWNREAEELLLLKRSEILNKNLWDVFEDAVELKFYSEYHRAVHENVAVRFEEYFPPLQKWFEVNAYPSVEGLSVFFKDITERKITAIQLKDLNQVLSSKVKELAISNRELEEFAYVASHDLQEPLRMITSFLTQLQRKYNDQLDSKAHQYINFAVDGARRMRQIILDLLDFSRVGHGDAKIEPVNLNEIIKEALILYRKVISDGKVEFKIPDMPVIDIPKTSIRQLMQNLISNAIKYQSPDNNTLIEIGFTETSEHWEIWVRDNGIGISSSYYEKIFLIFQRLHTREEFSGTGVGLAICRKIVENIGGKLWVESALGTGSTFFFTVPKRPQPELR